MTHILYHVWRKHTDDHNPGIVLAEVPLQKAREFMQAEVTALVDSKVNHMAVCEKNKAVVWFFTQAAGDWCICYYIEKASEYPLRH